MDLLAETGERPWADPDYGHVYRPMSWEKLYRIASATGGTEAS